MQRIIISLLRRIAQFLIKEDDLMKKRLMAIVLSIVLIFGLLPMSAFAEGATGTWEAKLHVSENVSVKHNETSTLELGFGVRSDDLALKTTQSMIFAVDLTIFDFVARNGNTATETLSESFSKLNANKYAYSAYEDNDDDFTKWTADVSLAVKGTTGYVMMQPHQDQADELTKNAEVILMSILLGFKEGKSTADLKEDSIRFVTKEEADALAQSQIIMLTDGNKNTQEYGKTDGTVDTLKITPTVSWDGITINPPTPAHTHIWATAWDKNVTHHWHNCTAAGCTLTDADNALKGDYDVHEYNQTVATDAYKASDATHAKKATYYKSCVCGAKGTETFESGDTVPHVFDQQNMDSQYLKSAATCQAKAVYYYSCVCGAKGTDTFEYGEKAAHNFEEGWTSDGTNHHYHRCLTEGCAAKDGQEACSGGDPATCQTKSVCATCKQPYGNFGSHNYTTDYKLENADSSRHYHVCTICNVKDAGEAHVADRSEATEDDPVKCTECGYVMTPALGHICKNHLTRHEAKNADCTNNGNTEYYECTCGKYYSDVNAESEITDHNSVIIPAGHKFTAVISEVPATCTETGKLAHRDCSVCKKHFATDSATELGSLEIPANGHKTTLVAKVDSTCTTEGTKAHYKCTVCEKLFQNEAGTTEATKDSLTIAKKSHTLTKTPAKAATCVAGGNDAYWTCSVCGNVYSDAAGTIKTSVAEMTKGADANAHDLELVPAVASTCKVQGHGEYYKCKLCGKMFDKNTNDKQELTTITLLPLAAHDYGTYYSDANSHWQFCKVCGDKKSAAHTPGADATDTTSQVCQDCGAVLKKATGTTECGHKEQAPGFNANDTQHWHYCANCGERVGDAENHNFGAEKVVKEATKTETGLKTRTCATCGWVQQTVIPATGGNTTPGGNGGTGGGFPTKDNNKTNNTGKVESQKTFDGGIALYVGLSVLSLTGSALVIRKKKEF